MDTMNGKIMKEGYTFDDVLLVPQQSEVLPNTVLLQTQLTKNIALNIPVLSVAMDTITEVALARQGGIGMIHKNMSIEDQVREVDKVKRNESGMITNPLTLRLNSTLEDAEYILSTYKISGLPIIDNNGVLVGIVTNRDLKYREIDKTPVIEIMSKDNLVTAKVGVSMEEAKAILLENRIEKLPIVDGDYHLKVGAAIGVSADVLERVEALYKGGVDIITVDSTHGHARGILEGVKAIKDAFPKLDVIAGNVVTKEGVISSKNEESLKKIYSVKKEFMFLRKSVYPLREAIGTLLKQEDHNIDEGTMIYLRDLYDHLIEVVETVETHKDIISNMVDIYLSSISNRTNDVMKVLTIFSTIFIPLTFLAGIYGMNFREMPELVWTYG